jgi:hypothetical protein
MATNATVTLAKGTTFAYLLCEPRWGRIKRASNCSRATSGDRRKDGWWGEERRGTGSPSPAPLLMALEPPAVTPLPRHRQRAGGRRVVPTGGPRAGHALHALGSAGHG